MQKAPTVLDSVPTVQRTPGMCPVAELTLDHEVYVADEFRRLTNFQPVGQDPRRWYLTFGDRTVIRPAQTLVRARKVEV
jgi:hypothetical protein